MAEATLLYGTEWCPHTKRSRYIMNQHNVAYTWIDIEKDKDACAFVEKTNKGYRSVPTIVFPDGTILVEPADGKLVEKCLAMKA